MARRKNLKQILTGVLAGSILISSVGPVNTVSAAEITQTAGEISVNPSLHYQTLDGWGTSLCWWGNVIGSWGDKDFNGNGRPDREEIAELAFSPDYLNLNIVRYNVGGGDKENTSMKRVEGIVPGWTVDMTGTEDGSGSFDADSFYAKETENMNDAGQLWMLEQANKYRKEAADAGKIEENDIINEVFSNSPPYYMTKSGSSTGGVDATSNLKEDCYDDFAAYMARAAKWIDADLQKKFGVGVDFIEPMNEPDTNYWAYGSTKQEGCTFEPGTEMSNMLKEMKKALVAEGLEDTIEMTGTDETSLGLAINSFKKLDTDAKNTMTTIGAHTYSGSDDERHTLRKLAASYDKKLWMSEVTKGRDGNGHNHDSIVNANVQGQSEGIMADLKYMQPTAWVAWLVADSEYECLQVNGNWGLIHTVFESDGPVADYHTNLVNSDGTAKEGVPGEGYWAVTKQLYAMMQYSKYLKAGYTMIDIGDENMCAALSPDGKELVIVAQNFGSDRTTTVDLSKFNKLGTAVCYQTSQEKNCEEVSRQDVAGGILNVTLPEYSVATYVIDVEADMNNYMSLVEADIATPTEEGVTVSELNKFTYTGSWKNQSTSEAGATAAFTFEGNRAVIYGTKSADGAKLLVSVDGGTGEEVSLAAENENSKAVIWDTGNLTGGKHTVTMTVAEGENGKTFALNCANIIQGELAAESGTTIRKIVPFNETMVVYFDELTGASEYTVEYGTSEDNLDKSVTASGNKAIIKGVSNYTTYYIRVKDDLGGTSKIVSGMAGVQDENVLYFVNVGTQNLTSTASDEVFGVYNSVLDQAYGTEDPVTGKMWGYTGTTNEPAYSDGDRWTSIRYSKSMKPLEYKFDLPAGTYNVTVAMLDPWRNSSRKTDILINGVTKDTGLVPTTKTKRTYQATLEEDGTLSVTAQPSSGNTSQDAIVSFIIIEKQDDNAISKVTPDVLCTVRGITPKLPETVKAVTAAGNTIEAAVDWDAVDAEAFDLEENSSVTITGTLTGTDTKVEQEVLIAPANMQYFVDCNWLNSTTYTAYDAAADLLNDKADQAYDQGSWGYVESYGAYDGVGSNEAGWYAANGQSIQYKLPFTEPGTYHVTFGFYDWWYYKERPVELKAYLDGEEIADWGTFTINQKKIQAEMELKLKETGEVTLSVEPGRADAPVLSWIMVTKSLNQDTLKKLLVSASTIDRSAYTNEQLASLDAAVENGKTWLLKSSATQDNLTAAAAAIEEILNSFETDKIVAKWKPLLEAALKENTADNSSNSYTAASFGTYEAAYKAVEKLLASSKYTEEEANAAVLALKNAYAALKKAAEESQKPISNPDTSTPEETAVTCISLNAKKIVMGVKEKATLKATVTGAGKGQKVTWKSDKTKIVTVSNAGKLTAKKAGTATITATAYGKSVSCKVTVKAAPKKIRLNAKSKSLKKGKTFQIKASIPKNTASYKITYSTSKKSVATVSSTGKVMAKKKGKATITVKTFNGKKATLKITVK